MVPQLVVHSQQVSLWGSVPRGTLCMLSLCWISSIYHRSNSEPSAEACKLLHVSGAVCNHSLPGNESTSVSSIQLDSLLMASSPCLSYHLV